MARVVCIVQNTPEGGVSFTWGDGPDTFEPYKLDQQLGVTKLREYSDAARAQLNVLVKNYLEALADPTRADEVAVEDGLALARVGYKLRQRILEPIGKDKKNIQDVAGWLKKLHDRGDVESLEIVAEGGPSVPWNLLYDTAPDEKAFRAAGPDAWRPFWGLRFNLAGSRRVDPRRRMSVWEAPKVLLVVDSMVRECLKEVFDPFASFAAQNKLTFIESRASLEEALSTGRPDLLYWLSHASPEALVLGEDEITPLELQDLLERAPADTPGGLVFLNACQTAQKAAGGTSFVDSVFLAQMGGLIATEQQTVDTFAAPRGLEFLEAFLVRGKSVGDAMQKLRSQVPLGLLYGTYCPPEIRVVRPGPGAAPVAVNTTAPAPGKPLGAMALLATHAPATCGPLPKNPYRSLLAYSVGDRALFAGRDDDVLRFAQVLDASGTRLLILHGESGVGKTSFLRAGVIPYLETECDGYRFARDRSTEDKDPVLMVRATNDPVSQIASALNGYCSKPFAYRTPLGEEVVADLPEALRLVLADRPTMERAVPADRDSLDALRDALCADAGLLGRVLAAVAERLPFTPMLVIDQAEEVFTLARTQADEENRDHTLDMLRRVATWPGGFKLVVSLRTEYHGRFVDKLRKGTRDASGVRDYLLTDFGLNALAEVIRRPTSETSIPFATEIPFEKYGFRYAEGVAKEIARRARASTISRQDSVLPLVQVICTQLYDLTRNRLDKTITLADLDDIGGFEGGMKRHAEGLVRRKFKYQADQEAFKRLLADDETQLYLRQSDGTLTTALLPAEFLARHWSGRMPFEEVLRIAAQGEWRLLRVTSLRIGSDEKEQPYVSLGHDALAKVLAGWHEKLRRDQRAHRYAAIATFGLLLAGVMTALSVFASLKAYDAREQRDHASRAASEAIKEQIVADDERKKAIYEQQRSERHEYLATMACANIMWQNEQYAESITFLERYHPNTRPPKPNTDFPGFEWNYQWHRTRLVTRTLASHSGWVKSASFSPDGKQIVTASDDKTARVWDVDTGKEIHTLQGHTGALNSASFSPDGRFIVTASRDATARVWDVHTGKEVYNLQGHRDVVNSASFSADGKQIVTASDDDNAWVWNIDTGKPVAIAILKGPAILIKSASFSPNGKHILTSGDGIARVWDVGSEKVIHNLKGHTRLVSSASFSPDGTRVVAASYDGTVRVWDVASETERLSLRAHSKVIVSSASFSPDGKQIVIATSDKSAQVWGIDTREPGHILKGHASWIQSASFSPDGKQIVTASDDKTARVWDVDTGKEINTLQGHTGLVNSASFSPDGKQIVTAGDITARVWDAGSEKEIRVLQGHQGLVSSASFSPDGTQIVTASRDGTARVWDVNSGGVVHNLNGQRDKLKLIGAEFISASFSSDGKRIVTANAGPFWVWDVASEKVIRTLKGHASLVCSASFSPNGKQIVTASHDHTARVWDVDSEKEIHNLNQHKDLVTSSSFSPDGTHIVTASYDGTARVWDVGSGNEIQTLKGHAGAVYSASFSPDGKQIVTASADQTVRVWDVGSATEIHILKGHTRFVNSASFSRDGNRIVTASDDKTARVWDVKTGMLLLILQADRAFYTATFSPDGTRIVTTSGDVFARIWDGRPIRPR